MTKTVLITGGAGFFGVHLARALADRGDQVLLYDLAAPVGELAYLLQPVADRVHFLRANVLDLAVLLQTLRDHRVAQIVHAAAVIDAAYYERQPFTVFQINAAGTVHALEAARLQGIERFLYISSLGVLPGRRYEPIDEEHPLLDTSGRTAVGPYGASKAAAELFGLSYLNCGIDFVALRFATIYGLGMHQPAYIKPMVEGAVQGSPVRFPSGAAMQRNYAYIRDCIQAAILALDTDSTRLVHRIFNIADPEVITVDELASLVRAAVPGADIEVGPGLSAYEQRDIERRGTISIQRAEQELGFRRRFGLRAGIADYAQAYRTYLKATRAP